MQADALWQHFMLGHGSSLHSMVEAYVQATRMTRGTSTAPAVRTASSGLMTSNAQYSAGLGGEPARLPRHGEAQTGQSPGEPSMLCPRDQTTRNSEGQCGRETDAASWHGAGRAGVWRGEGNLLLAKTRLGHVLQHLRTRLCSFRTYVRTFARPTISMDNTA